MKRYLVRPDHDNGWDDQQHFVDAIDPVEAIKLLYRQIIEAYDDEETALDGGTISEHRDIPDEDEIGDYWTVWEVPIGQPGKNASVLDWPFGSYFKIEVA